MRLGSEFSRCSPHLREESAMRQWGSELASCGGVVFKRDLWSAVDANTDTTPFMESCVIWNMIIGNHAPARSHPSKTCQRLRCSGRTFSTLCPPPWLSSCPSSSRADMSISTISRCPRPPNHFEVVVAKTGRLVNLFEEGRANRAATADLGSG